MTSTFATLSRGRNTVLGLHLFMSVNSVLDLVVPGQGNVECHYIREPCVFSSCAMQLKKLRTERKKERAIKMVKQSTELLPQTSIQKKCMRLWQISLWGAHASWLHHRKITSQLPWSDKHRRLCLLYDLITDDDEFSNTVWFIVATSNAHQCFWKSENYFITTRRSVSFLRFLFSLTAFHMPGFHIQCKK